MKKPIVWILTLCLVFMPTHAYAQASVDTELSTEAPSSDIMFDSALHNSLLDGFVIEGSEPISSMRSDYEGASQLLLPDAHDDVIISVEIIEKMDIAMADLEPSISSQYMAQDADDDSDRLLASAGLPDVVLGNFEAPMASPLPAQTPLEYTFHIGNFGTADAPPTPLAVYIDNALMGTTTIVGPEAGYAYIVGITLSMPYTGSREIKLEANYEPRLFAESLYTNNTVRRTWTYQLMNVVIDTAAVHISTNQGSDYFENITDVTWYFTVDNNSNIGLNVPVAFILDGMVIVAEVVQIDAATRVFLSVDLPASYMRYGSSDWVAEAVLWVDPNWDLNDIDRSNNRLDKDFTILPDTKARFAGRFASATDLRVFVMSDAIDLIAQDGMTTATVQAQLNMWNRFSNRVNLTVDQSASTSHNIVMGTLALTDDAIGMALIRDTKGELITDLYGDKSNYGQNFVILDSSGLYASCPYQVKLNTIGHEFGHALGLAHPFGSCGCFDDSMMNYDDRVTWTTEHDKANLLAKY